jgi:excisionase family DNA binding protein
MAQTNPTATPRYRSLPDIAREYNVDRSSVWRWVKAGRLPAVRVGVRNYRVAAEDVAAILGDANENGAA